MALATMKTSQMGKAAIKTVEKKSAYESESVESSNVVGESASEDHENDEHEAEEQSETEIDEDEQEEMSSDEAEKQSASSENNESNEDEQEEGNAAWADSIAKVLSSTKPKTKKSVVLSRAKKIKTGKEKTDDKEKKKDFGFEIDGEIKEEKPDKEELKERLKKRKNMPLSLRVRPSWKDIERERMLRKVATKGVVQLFNAVRIQQKDLQHQLDEAGPLDSRKDAVLNNINKRKFLDVLMSGSRAKSEVVDKKVKIEKEDESSDDESDEAGNSQTDRKRKSEWSVLRPDFMTNKKIKHWDEQDESDENPGDSNEDSNDDE